jgi:ribose transport system ATP-binding protein
MLRLSTIKKAFSGVEVLHDISFSMERGCVTALVGENGAGKSTLMKILCGVYTDYNGEIFIDDEKIFFKNPWEAKHAGISIIHQELSCIPDLTVAENIFLGNEPLRKFGLVNFSRLRGDARTILKEFDFPYSPNTIVRNLSVGWQQIVEIAHALSSDAGIFILDEPTSALAESEIKILFKKIRLLKEKGKIIIFISHRLEEIYEIADEIAVMRDGRFIGKYSATEITRSELIGKMVGSKFYETKLAKSVACNEMALQVEDLNVFDNSTTYLSGITFTLMNGEILGLAGLLGSGKSELLKFLFGELKAQHTGKIMLGENIYVPKSASRSLTKKIFYLPKDRKTEGIFAGLDIIKNSSISVLSNYASGGYIHKTREAKAVANKSLELNLKFKSLYQNIQTLSGGNQQKVLIGRGLLNNPKLLLLDEPTRGIDIGAKEGIYNLINGLSSKGMSFIISSSDIPELLRICDRILVLFNGVPAALLNAQETDTNKILHYAFNEGQL